jgi:hypothetical protein
MLLPPSPQSIIRCEKEPEYTQKSEKVPRKEKTRYYMTLSRQMGQVEPGGGVGDAGPTLTLRCLSQ